MNPPYNTITLWIEKALAEYRAGNVTEAILLLPARVDTKWYRLLDSYPRCEVSGRLTFVDAEYPALFPSVLVYVGEREVWFAKAFQAYGRIMQRIDLDSVVLTMDEYKHGLV